MLQASPRWSRDQEDKKLADRNYLPKQDWLEGGHTGVPWVGRSKQFGTNQGVIAKLQKMTMSKILEI
jgi:hypothetical protein